MQKYKIFVKKYATKIILYFEKKIRIKFFPYFCKKILEYLF